MVNERSFTEADHDFIAAWISEEKERRASSPERKKKERIWAEVDRQVSMTPPEVGHKKAWQSNIEPGMLADGLETFSDDTLRIAMPTDRKWFTPKVEIESEMDGDDEDDLGKAENQLEQRKRGGALRSLMVQQHIDTGFRENVKLSVKEAYKHGSFVAEVRFERFPKWHDGGRIEDLGSPVWITHSMWNCYPAPSGTLQVSALSYQGSMIIEVETTWADLSKNTRLINREKLNRVRDTKKNPKIIKFFGDVFIPAAKDGVDRFLPNQEMWVCCGVLIFAKTNDLPYPPIIYVTVEKDDVRDDYASSQLIKRSPTHKAAAESLNSFIDGTALSNRPPVAYNSLDPRFAATGLSIIEPGAEIPTRGSADIKPIFVANPQAAFDAYQVLKQEVERGTKADVRAGVAPSTEQTRFEIQKIDERAETRTVDFVGVLERHGLRPFLYMQHEFNKKHLTNYPFYCDDPDLPNFMRVKASDLIELANLASFEITGSRGVLGEERRREGMLYVAGQLMQTDTGMRMMGDEGVAAIALEILSDFGVKDPERFVPHAPDIKDGRVEKVSVDELERIEKEMNEALQELQGVLGEVQQENFKLTEELERKKTDINSLAEDNKLLEEQIQLVDRKLELTLALNSAAEKLKDDAHDLDIREHKLAVEKVSSGKKGDGK